jgi:hypothetical protein
MEPLDTKRSSWSWAAQAPPEGVESVVGVAVEVKVAVGVGSMTPPEVCVGEAVMVDEVVRVSVKVAVSEAVAEARGVAVTGGI